MMTIQTFQQWLENQTEREDIVGAFAFAILQDDELPTEKKRVDEHQMWATWLVARKPAQEMISTFNIAWKEYQAAKV